jgi:hypothetical protein
VGGPGGHGSRYGECGGTALPRSPARRTVGGLLRSGGSACRETRPGTTLNDPHPARNNAKRSELEAAGPCAGRSHPSSTRPTRDGYKRSGCPDSGACRRAHPEDLGSPQKVRCAGDRRRGPLSQSPLSPSRYPAGHPERFHSSHIRGDQRSCCSVGSEKLELRNTAVDQIRG